MRFEAREVRATLVQHDRQFRASWGCNRAFVGALRGPILGLVLTGVALQGATTETTLLLLAYSTGAATSLALAVLVGGRVFAQL